MNKPFIFLGNGKVHFVNSGGDVFPLESKYAADLTAKALKAQERHAWKNEAVSRNPLLGMGLWGKEEPPPLAITFTSIAAGKRSDEFLYTLKTDHLCAICSVRGEAAEEQRLWNHQSKRFAHLHIHPTLGHIVCSSEKPNGCAHILIRTAEDGSFGEVTEGDAVDTAPRWIPGEKLAVVYQSAGVGRTKDGTFAWLGPFAIHSVDVETGELKTLAEDSKFDFLTPRILADGTLFYIKRPYTGNAHAGVLDHVKDFFLFPFRLAAAIFGFLNFFSMMYSGRQLKTVKAADAKNLPIPQMMLWGNLIKAQQADAENPNPGLVPKTWQLIRKREGAAEEILAAGVACFDAAEDGRVVFSNGRVITEITRDAKQTKIAENPFVQSIEYLR
jgi:hypothetical protein